jgi:Tfp pilus assembly protein PilF/SAM-dependent methyltransferase
MTDLDRTFTNPPADRAANGHPATSRSVATAMVAEGNALMKQGRIPEAMARFESALQADPQCAPAHLNRGNVLVATGQLDEARSAYQLAIGCDARYHAAYYNLGNLDCRAGEFSEALRNYQTAIGINPQSAAAFVGMGNALVNLGRTAEALESYQRALTIAPGSADAHFNLGILAMSQGRHQEAVARLRRACELRPNPATRLAFATCAAQTTFTVDDPLLRAALTTAITEAWLMPPELSRAAFSVIMLDGRTARCIDTANASWPVRVPRAALFAADGLAAVAADPLLHALLVTAPVNSVQLERFLTCARHALLEIASSADPPDAADLAALQFYAALARQCFINEYVFDSSDSERLAAAGCRRTVQELLDSNAAIPPLLLLAVAAYFPLHLLRDARRLLAGDAPGPIAEVLHQQIREPLEEQALRASIECLTPLAGGVSEAVREQYEENPYPRWVTLQMRERPMRFNTELRYAMPYAQFEPMPDESAPQALLAGCGTGRDAIFLARRFEGVSVLAIDLSLSSLSYARRKTRELGLTNISYAQADILGLEDSPKKFDIISAIGVLHHLADPFEGWRVLLSRLKPGGFMCLGLYSQVARKPVVEARKFIAAQGYENTPDGIRRFRRNVLAQDASPELQSLRYSYALYSMSDCRDLVFHAREEQLTLPQIDSFLKKFALRFIGFELDLRVLNEYRARFAEDSSCSNLRNWASFEAENPDTFTGMYRFWIQSAP